MVEIFRAMWTGFGNSPIVYVVLILWVVVQLLKKAEQVETFRALLALMDTPGGHIILLCMFVWFGWHMFQQDATAGGQVITGAWAALLVLLNNRRQTPSPGSTDMTISTAVTPPLPGGAPAPAVSSTTVTTTAAPGAVAPPAPAAAAPASVAVVSSAQQ